MISAQGVPSDKTWEQAVLWLRSQPSQKKLVFDSYYDDPLFDAADRYWKGAEWKAIVPLLGSVIGHAADIGAGRGIASYALAKEGFKVVAVEPDDSRVVGSGAIRGLTALTALPISVAESFSESLPIESDTLDVVFARATLHHTRDLGQACREFFRVLKPGGRFVAVREHVISRHGHLEAFLNAHPLHHLYGGENAFLLNEYLEAFREAGFKVEAVLRPLTSTINFAPQTMDTLRSELVDRAAIVPGAASVLRTVLRSERRFSKVLSMLSHFDNRPGRLYSFVCSKP